MDAQAQGDDGFPQFMKRQLADRPEIVRFIDHLWRAVRSGHFHAAKEAFDAPQAFGDLLDPTGLSIGIQQITADELLSEAVARWLLRDILKEEVAEEEN